jgi:hypothetical protein
MTFAERALYHQIHPAKLATDITTACLAAYFFWQHRLASGLLMGFVPSVVVSAMVLRTANLEQYRVSRFGKYVRRYMDNRLVDAARLAGVGLLWIGAWHRQTITILAGASIIVACWSSGAILSMMNRSTLFER